MSLTLKRSLKTKFVGEHTETYVVFECLVCNLLEISPLILKLCLRSQDFFLNVFSECRKCFRDSNIKNFPDPLANLWLRYSAHTLGDRILSMQRGWQGENGPFGSFAPLLKNP